MLPLAGIPLLIHWLSRRFPKKFLFSSIDEIRRTLAGRSRVFRWRHLLMLLLRTLALGALLMAFLKPVIAPSAAATKSKRNVILLVDQSLSTDCAENGTTAHARIREEVKRLLDSLDADDRFNLIRVDQAPVAAFPNFSSHTEAALQFLDDSPPPMTRADFHVANQMVAELARGTKGTLDLYYFSDFQRHDWADVGFDALPKGAHLYFVTATDDAKRGNRAIVSMDLGEGAVIAGGEAEVKVRVANHSEQPWSAKLEAGFGPGFMRESQIALAPWSVGDFTLIVPVPEGGLLKLTANLPPDNLPADDRRNLVVKVREREEVIILTGDEDGGGATAPSLFLTTAVDPFAGKGVYRPKHLGPSALNPAALAASSRLIASRLPLLNDTQAGTLVTFLRGGGGMILFLDGPADAANVGRLGNLTGEPLPIRITGKLGPDHLAGGAMRVASGDFHSRFLRLFDGVRRQNLAQLEFYDLYHAAATGTGKILLTYADGTPALTESSIGLGTLLVCNFSVAEASSNLARQRLFPAWIHEMLLRMGQGSSAAMEPFVVGDTVAGETWAAEAAGRELLGPRGETVPARVDVNGERLRISFNAATPGFHHLPGGDHDLLAFAVNPDADESDLRTIDPTVLPDRAGSSHREARFVGATTDYQVLLRGKPVFHWFLLGALALLFVEGVLFKKAPRTT